MRNCIRTLVLLVFLAACASDNSASIIKEISPSPSDSPVASTTPLPTDTSIGTLVNFPTTTPIVTPTITPTITPQPINDPGLIITLGEKVSSPWNIGVPLFSPDGNLIALATNPRISYGTHTLISYSLNWKIHIPKKGVT